MASRVGVFARVPIGRAVTAACSSALLTRTQVHPPRSDLDAVFAFLPLRMLDVVNCLNVLAGTRR